MASSSNPLILLVGRLSGPKNDVILSILRNVAPKVIQRFPRARFTVLGGPVAAEHTQLEKQFPYISFLGHQTNLKFFYQRAMVVVGAGRVALEAMALKKPVVAIGERLYIGPLLPEKVERAKATNFGDCFEKEVFDWAQMGRDLTALLQNKGLREKAAKTGYALVQSEYNMETILPRMEELYRKVLLEKNLSSVHELPVLMYHRVVDKAPAFTKYNLHITQKDLDRQLEFLKKGGFEPIGFEDLLTRRVPKKPIILTFDDGYEDNFYYLLPLLEKYRMKAVLYLLGNRSRKNNFWDIPQGEPEAKLLTDKQVLAMDKTGLVEFGAHSLNHARLPTLGRKEMEREVGGSKKALEDLLKKPVVSFAYPYGLFNEEVKKATGAAGFTFGIAVNSGPARFGGDLLEIRRVHMMPETSPFQYLKKTSGFYLRYRLFMGKSRDNKSGD